MRAERETAVLATIEQIASALGRYVFRPATEDTLQVQVTDVLARDLKNATVTREVTTAAGRYDVLVEVDFANAPLRIVLELKLTASAPAVERQASRYAAVDDVDAVMVITSSRRLTNELRRAGADRLGGKPFAIVALRSF